MYENSHMYFCHQLLRKTVDSYQPGHTIPSCQVQLVWVKDQEYPKMLSHKLHIAGVRPPDTYIRIFRYPIPPGERVYTLFIQSWLTKVCSSL